MQSLAILGINLELAPVPSEWTADRLRRRVPHCWRPEISERVRVWATPRFPRGERERGPDGLHPLAVFDADTEIIHMVVVDNFY